MANRGVIALEYIVRSAYYTLENADVSEILREFKIGHQHIAIVVDEFGSIIGIASVEDLLEEIVGEVWDEDDLEQKTMMYIECNKYVIQACESISNVNDGPNPSIPESNCTTVNGWVLELCRILENGEKITWNNYSIKIKDADLKKVNKVVLKNVLYNKRTGSQLKNTWRI